MGDTFDLLVAAARATAARGARTGGAMAGVDGQAGPDPRVAELVARVRDWATALVVAESQGMAPLAAREVLRLPGDGLDGDARALLTEAARRATVAALDATCELAAVAEALRAAGVAALPYKGPALALDAFGDVAARQFADLDIVVPADE
ncbi:MAG: nucleotidyltransferase family protein, partial [Gemmatimonadota bacterium]|nr:nucleotidyltransferase family protein [Gemmatimonadota bacterium]